MVCHVLLEGQGGSLTILTDCPFPPFWSELLNSEHSNLHQFVPCTVIFTQFKLKICEKRTGMEPETDLFQATIMGTGKSIDFYIFV